MELKNLPQHYTYLLIQDEDIVFNDTVFRVKEITDPISAEKWIKEFSVKTKTTWRKAATYPKAGRINIFRVDLRCVHFTDSRAKGLRSSKNTNCPAKLNVIVRRIINKSRTKYKDELLPGWPCIITFKDIHNHPLSSADVLKHRDMSTETYKNLLSLFHQGHNASSALQCLKSDLHSQYGDRYLEIAGDAHYVPSLSVVSKLFKKWCTDDSFSGDNSESRLEFSKDGQGQGNPLKTEDGEEYLVVICSETDTKIEDACSQDVPTSIEPQKSGLCDRPSLNLPAVEKIASSETELISALNTFASAKKSKRSHTFIRRRKSRLAGPSHGVPVRMEVKDLPEHYTYLLTPKDEDVCNHKVYRVKEITDPISAQKWIMEFSVKTKTTWRKATTYPKAGRINIFRVDLKCVHFTDSRAKGLKSSKNTNCPAKLTVIVRRSNDKCKTKIKDDVLPGWPCIITFKDVHNHPLSSADVLKHRDMSAETYKNLLSLFHQGHNASSALQCLKSDLHSQYGDRYLEIAGDAHYVPSVSVVSKLFKKWFTDDSFFGDNSESRCKEDGQGQGNSLKTEDGEEYLVVICSETDTKMCPHLES